MEQQESTMTRSGDREDPSILLISGYTEPMMSFKEGFCQFLVDAGYHVIRFDNRDGTDFKDSISSAGYSQSSRQL